MTRPDDDDKVLYDSDVIALHKFIFNAKLFTSLINGFGGQTSTFLTASEWVCCAIFGIGTMIGCA